MRFDLRVVAHAASAWLLCCLRMGSINGGAGMESKPLLGLPFLNSKIALHSNANVALRKEQYDAPSNPLLAVLIVVPFSGLLFQSSSSDTLGVGAE